MGRRDGDPGGQPLRPDRPGTRRAELRSATHAGAAARRGCFRYRKGPVLELEAGSEAGVRVPSVDGGARRRGPGGCVDEIDLDYGVWTIPAPRTKTNREHRVPLTRRALEILGEARAVGRGSPLVFPMRGNPLSNTAMSRLLKRLGIGAVPHGFRSSFRDWAAEETDHPREVAEAALAHVVRNQVEAAYRRTDLFERRRLLMEDWAAYLGDDGRVRESGGTSEASVGLARGSAPWTP